ncbi:hypothetical protein OKW21_004226 [Catalinimonas alkaloidigena]|uniref:hypothetical protein n=1 Tax=Catalinimonas alkaloidigena TaxID=1075417 RepID=UPI00240712A7|nr:hypothetical protein [Catalinimonas alkaloidigena]MDF9798963.1 hypothetical protein [Catalinimonas alkaloidigena]
MKNICFTLFAFSISLTASLACDVCGCSLGSNYFGILPQYDKNFVGLRWYYSSFFARMDHNSEYMEDEYSNDTYQTFELWSRLYLTDRIQLFASIPYSFNQMEGSHQKVTAAGLGDISVLANYTLVNTGEDVGNPWRHTWLAGGGVKLPTGDFRQQDQGLLVNPNFQLGTGSTDFVLNTIYTVRFQNVGLNLGTTAQLNTENPEGYRFGNQWNASTQLFYWRQMKYLSILPNIGMYYETGEMHTDNGIRQLNSGGEVWLAQVGLDIYYRDVAVGFTFKNPVSQQMNSDEVAAIESKERIMISLIYNF